VHRPRNGTRSPASGEKGDTGRKLKHPLYAGGTAVAPTADDLEKKKISRHTEESLQKVGRSKKLRMMFDKIPEREEKRKTRSWHRGRKWSKSNYRRRGNGTEKHLRSELSKQRKLFPCISRRFVFPRNVLARQRKRTEAKE